MILTFALTLALNADVNNRPAMINNVSTACTIITNGAPRNVHTNNTWDMGIVPYQFDPAVLQDNRTRTREVMDEIESWADISFVPYTGIEPNWITIRNSPAGQGNSATVGQRPNGVVNIVLWESKGMILHELMHTLGFLHEQSRADRDTYIELYPCAYANGNYNIAPDLPAIGPYDFDSVTHYTPLWGCHGDEAYIIRAPYYDYYQSTVGTWHYDYRGPSDGDIWSLYTLYGGDPVPGPFVYEIPENGSVVRQSPDTTLTWEPAGLASSYLLEIDRSPIFRFPIVEIETSEPHTGIPDLAPGTYYWRVAARNHRGETYPRPKPNDIWSFSIACADADLAAPYGTLDFFDVSSYLDAYNAQAPAADLNSDGSHNFFDVSLFLISFANGCQSEQP